MAGGERAGEQDGAADGAAEVGGEARRAERCGAEGDGMGLAADGDAEIGEEGEEVVDISDVRDVIEVDGLVGEEARRNHGKRGIFVAHGAEGAGKGMSSFDDETAHERRKGGSGTGGGCRQVKKEPETRTFPAL